MIQGEKYFQQKIYQYIALEFYYTKVQKIYVAETLKHQQWKKEGQKDEK